MIVQYVLTGYSELWKTWIFVLLNAKNIEMEEQLSFTISILQFSNISPSTRNCPASVAPSANSLDLISSITSGPLLFWSGYGVKLQR